MRQIKINIDSDVKDRVAIAVVEQVMSQGRISDNGNQYCYHTTSKYYGVEVSARRSRAGVDTFWVYKIRDE